MQHQRTQLAPHGRVWALAHEYVEAAEHLLDVNRLQAAVVLASLAGEIVLKSFLVEEDLGWAVRTGRGHQYIDIFGKLTDADRNELLICSREVDPTVDLMKGLTEFGGLFVDARYRYEPDSPRSVSSEAVYFSRHLCDAVLLLGRRRCV